MNKRSFRQEDPEETFGNGSAMEKALMRYRCSAVRGKRPLISPAMRMVPPHTDGCGDLALVRSITRRTQALLSTPDELYRTLKGRVVNVGERVQRMSNAIQALPGLKETWSKTVLCSIHFAYPQLKLLQHEVDVGRGAREPLRQMVRVVEGHADMDDKAALAALHDVLSRDQISQAVAFRGLLKRTDDIMQKDYPKEWAAFNAGEVPGCIGVVTLQVQLCEFRQFKNYVTRGDNEVLAAMFCPG